MKSDKSNDDVTFFQKYQKINTLVFIKNTINDSINNWLSSIDDDEIKIEKLQQIVNLGIESSIYSKTIDSLPDFLERLWNNPHKTINALNSTILKREIRELIKETAQEKIKLVNGESKSIAL